MALVRNGMDCVERYESLFKGKRIGLITSPSGLDLHFHSTIDLLHRKFGLEALFSPEHGVRGNIEPGDFVDTYHDASTGVPVYSLYRKDSKRLTDEMLENVDLIAYDIQDVGARYYTFISTMLLAMEDCARTNKDFVVFDRINPLGGQVVEGNILRDGFRSFVGAYPLCMRYGLTVGEFAEMANDSLKLKCRLHVIPCEGWSREMLFHETGQVWVPPTMGIPTFETALLYPGMCLFEGTNLSEGRGTTCPFTTIGAPFIDAETLARVMNDYRIPGVKFRPVYFKPTASKFKGLQCGGVQVHVLEAHAVKSVTIGVTLLFEIRRRYADRFMFLPPYQENGHPFIDLLDGDNGLRMASDEKDLFEDYDRQSRQFAAMKTFYHRYK